MTTVSWHLQADYMETCNCDFGCPCNFNGLPTGGRWNTGRLPLRSGLYGDVLLDGVELVYAASWPRAIHDGDVTLHVYVSDKPSAEQRQGITEIVYGRGAGGSGCFAVFAATFRYVLDPLFVPIDMIVDGKKSHFSVPGILEVSLTPHTHPVSGNEQEVEINLPKGFIWKSAQAAKTAVMRILSPNLNFDHAGRNAFYSVVEYQGP